LHGYLVWGLDVLLAKIEGMFAFSIFDRRSQEVILVRDRVGIKPIYFAIFKDRFLWSSELKAIENYVGKEHLERDNTALYDFLTYRYVPTPKTLYKDIYKLEPAHYLRIDTKTLKISKERYWALEVTPSYIDLDKAAEQLRALLGQTVRGQMVSDVPVGFYLSGGMDSSVVVAEAARCAGCIQTYSIGFDVPEYDETSYADLIARQYDTAHKMEIFNESSALSDFSKLKTWYDEPFGDTSAFSTYLVSSVAKKSSTVVLTGDGGDEVFGGYNWYFRFRELCEKQFRIWGGQEILGRMKNRYRKRVLGKILHRVENYYLADDLEIYAKLMGGLLKKDKLAFANKMGIPDDYDDYWYFRKHYRPELPLLTRLQYLDFNTFLPDDILTKVDRASMQVSLEARVPLLSTALVEFAFSLPESIRYYKGELKGLQKYAYREKLPEPILFRSKKGFSIPTGVWRERYAANEYSTQEFILRELFAEC